MGSPPRPPGQPQRVSACLPQFQPDSAGTAGWRSCRGDSQSVGDTVSSAAWQKKQQKVSEDALDTSSAERCLLPCSSLCQSPKEQGHNDCLLITCSALQGIIGESLAKAAEHHKQRRDNLFAESLTHTPLQMSDSISVFEGKGLTVRNLSSSVTFWAFDSNPYDCSASTPSVCIPYFQLRLEKLQLSDF